MIHNKQFPREKILKIHVVKIDSSIDLACSRLSGGGEDAKV